MIRRLVTAALVATVFLVPLSFGWHLAASAPSSSPPTQRSPVPSTLPYKDHSGHAISASNQSPQPDRAMLDTVRAALPELYRIASVDPDAFGMGPAASLEHTSILSPYPTYRCWRDQDTPLQSDQDLVSRLKLTGAWYVPVDWGDGEGAIIYVSRQSGAYRVTGVGGLNTLIALRSALASFVPNVERVYFVDEPPDRPDVILAVSPDALVAVPITKANIDRSRRGLPLDAGRALDVVNATPQ